MIPFRRSVAILALIFSSPAAHATDNLWTPLPFEAADGSALQGRPHQRPWRRLQLRPERPPAQRRRWPPLEAAVEPARR